MKAFIPLVVLIALIPFITSLPQYRDVQKLYEGERKFSIKLLHALHRNAYDSTVVSPRSIYHGLLLIYVGAEGETEVTLKRALYLDWANSKEDVVRVIHLLSDQVNIHPEIEYRNISRLYITDQAVLKPSIDSVYGDKIEKVNFAQGAVEIVRLINRYIEKVTHGYIKNFYPSDLINPDTNLVLINAAYLYGKWELPFDHKWTTLKNFYGYETVQVPMMRRHGHYVYGEIEELNSVYVRLPYGEDDALAMYVLVPRHISTSAVDVLIDGLSVAYVDRILERKTKQYIRVEVPRFKVKTQKALGELLPIMGVENLFDNINLNGISDSLKLKLDDLRHYSKLVVNEEGSTDVAVSGTYSINEFDMTSGSRVVADRPFVYLIHDRSTNGILMAGVYRGPRHH